MIILLARGSRATTTIFSIGSDIQLGRFVMETHFTWEVEH
jgi:hypothetical protein